MPRFSAIGFAPAATLFTPSRKIACARIVAVVVPSPATSEVFDATSRTICAPMFSSGSLQLDLLGHGHAVFGDGRTAEFLLQNDVAALGSQGDLHRVRQLVDAAQNCLPGILAIYNLFC